MVAGHGRTSPPDPDLEALVSVAPAAGLGGC
jgi:hypothetical protein